MKKFLLFSVLSILLSVFYTANAQECCFWLENADPDQPTDLYSLNPMSTSLNEWQYYYFKFENNCLLEPNDKVSIDWSFEVNGVKVDALIAGQFGVEIEMKNPMAQSLSNDGYVPSGQLLSGQGLLSTLGCPNNTDYPGGLGGPHPNSYCTNTYPMFSYFAQGQNNNLYNFLYVHFLEYASDNNLIRLKINRKSWGDYKLTFKLILRKNGEQYENEYRLAEGTTHYYIGGKLAQYDRQIGSFTLEEQTYSEGTIGVCSGETISVGLDPNGNTYDFVRYVYIPDDPVTIVETVPYYSQDDDCIDFIDSMVTYTMTWSPMPTAPTAENVKRCRRGDLVFVATHEYLTLYPGTYDGHITYNWYSDAGLTTLVHTGATYIMEDQPEDTHVHLWVAATIEGCEGPAVHVEGYVYKVPVVTLTNPADLCPVNGQKGVKASVINLYQDPTYDFTINWIGASANGELPGDPYEFYANVNVTDNCGEEYVYEFKITDNHSGCFAEVAEKFTLNDTEDPTFDVPAAYTVYRDADCNFDIDPDITGEPTNVADNCGPVTVTHLDAAPVQITGECESNVTITRTWTVTDHCGNATSKDQVITVKDNTAPTFDVPAAYTVYRDANCEYNINPDITGRPTNVLDNCTPTADIVVTYIDADSVQIGGECTSNVTITRTWTVTDACGNATSKDQVITVKDNTAPTFDVPAAYTVYRNATCGYDIDPDITGRPTNVLDNCTPTADIVVNYTDGDPVQITGECASNVTITRTWTATDNCGNKAEATQVITVKDNSEPTFDVPAAYTAYRDATCGYDINPDITGRPTNVLDNCTPTADIVVNYTDGDPVQIDGECASNVTITRTWTATDNCGNVAEATQVITIKDNTAPTFDVPAAYTAYRDANCEYNILPAVAGEPTNVLDNCTPTAQIVVNYTDATPEQIAGECASNLTITRTWTATDLCGNETTAIQVITVKDNTAPTFDVPAAYTAYRDADCEYNILPAVAGEPTNVLDNCTPTADIVVDYDDALPEQITGECASNVTITRTWTATDNCGNVAEATQVITIKDNTAPTFTAPDDIAICKDGSGNYDASLDITGEPTGLADNCTAAADITVTFEDDLSHVGDITEVGYILRTFTIKDNCGNAATHVQTITLNPAPIATIAADPESFCLPEDGSPQEVVITLTPNDAALYTFSITEPTLPVADTTSTITVEIDTEGDYYFTGIVTDIATGCSSDPVQVKVEALLFPYFEVVDFQHKRGCRDDSLALNGYVELTNNPYYTYSIEPSLGVIQNGNKFSNLLLGTYTITATHDNGCTYEMDYEVILDSAYLPVAQLLLNGEDKDIAVCWDADLLIPTLVHDLNNIPGNEYLFSIIVPTNVHIQGSNAIKILTPGTYKIGGSIFNKTTGCGDTTWHWVYANATPTIDITYDGACMGTDIVLTANATPALTTPHSYTYSWTSSLTGDTILGTEATLTRALTGDVTFTVVVTAHYHYTGVDAEGVSYNIDLECPATQNVFIEPDPVPVFELEVLNQVEHCNSITPGKIGISSGWDVNHTWTARLLPDGTPFEVIADTFDVTVGGTYEVKAVSVDRCEYIRTIFVDSLLVGFDAILHANTEPLDPDLDYSNDLAFCWTNTNKTIYHEVRYTNKPIFEYEYTINTPIQILQQNNQYSIVTEPGDYMLVGWVINITTGCRSKNDTLYVYAVETPEFDISPNQAICYGDEITIGIVPPTGTYDVIWTGTDLNPPTDSLEADSVTITPTIYDASTTYTAIVTVSNDHDVLPCSVTDSVIITINPLPEIAPPYVNHVSCHGGNDGRIEVYVIVGTAPFSYEWSPAAPDTNIITGLAANTYGLVITDAHGCREAMTPIVVDEPTEIIEFSRAITHVDCHGDSTGTIIFVATGGTPGTTPNPAYTYYLYQGSTLIDSNNTGTFVKLPAGTYSITVEDSNKCEKVFDNFEVTQPAEPVTATLTPTNPNCYYGATGKVMANPTGGTPYLPPHDTYNYSWSNGESTQEITGLAEGWYTVTVTDSLGCVFIDSVQLVAPDEITLVSLDITPPDCHGSVSGIIDIVATGGTGDLEYQLNDTPVFQPDGHFTSVPFGYHTVTVRDENLCTASFTAVVDQPDLLVVSIAADTVHINCFGGATGAASVVVTGGTYPYNYAWSHSHADSTATGLIAGTYKVTVTDAHGCINFAEVEIRQLEMISLDTTSTVITPATCHGTNTGSITVVAQGGSGTFEYSIDGGGTYQPSGTFTNLFGDTTYTITVRDSIHNSCIDTFPGFYVPEPTKLTLDPAVITDSIKCHGGFAKVQITATGGNGGYTYTLQGHSSNNTGTFINVLAGEYKYSVVDSKGCEDTSTVKLNIPQPTQLQINTAEITDSILCHGGKANVTITATDGTPPYRYVLGTDTNTTGLFEVFAGTYSYAVIDANLCVEAPAATIVVPNPDTLYLTSASATTIACYGQFATVTITATGGTGAHIYTLEGHGNSTTGTFSNIPAGVYGYSVVDQKGCKDTSSTSLVITQPDTLIATAAVTGPIQCYGESGTITVTATGGTTPYTFYLESDFLYGNDSVVFGPMVAGTYEYFVKDNNNCETHGTNIVIGQPDSIVVTTDTTHVKCNGGNDGSLEITNVTGGVGPYTYKWSRDPLVDTTNMITGLHAGTYDVTVTDANNCDVSYSYDVNEPTAIGLTLTPTSGTTTCIYDTTKVYATVVGGTPGYSYEWTLDGDTTVIEISDTIYVTPGKYHITVTDNAGCEKVDSITINAHPVPIITSNEPPQQCDSTAFTVTAISSIAGGTWTAQLYSGVNNVEPPGLISTTDSSITYTVPGNYKDTTLYIVFEYSLTPCTYIHTTDTIKISGEPRLRIYRESTEDNYVTINQNEPTYFHFMVDDLCNASNDLRLSIDYQIYRNDTLVTTFSDYFSSANSMNFQMGLQGTGLMPPTYQPINYNLNHVSSHFPYAASNGAVLGMYQFDFFNLRFFESREGTVNINYIKEPGEYVIHFQLVTHYENSSMLQQHGNEVAVNMIGGRVGGNHFYDGTYYTKTWSTNTMTIVVNPVTSPAPLVPFTFERDVTVDPASLTVEMRIYPNPTTPNEEVKIELSNLSSTGVLTIANINGLVLEKYQLKDISKNHDLVLKVNNYAPGIYFVTYRSKEGLVTKKLVIQSR